MTTVADAAQSPRALGRILVLGDGEIGEQVAQQLGARWRVVLLDRRGGDGTVPVLDDEPTAGVIRLAADGTSRLVLERAGISGAYCLVAAIRDDEANLEACRLARQEFQLPKAVAVCFATSYLPRYEALGVDAIVGGKAIASMVSNRVEPVAHTAEAIGLGQGEIIEVEVLPGSAVVNRPLKTFSPHQWLVAAVYRQRRLIVPHGGTTLEPHDRVLLVGNPAILPAVASYFRIGGARFPQPYGSRIGALILGAPEPRFLEEIAYLAQVTEAEGIELHATADDPTWRATALAVLGERLPAERIRWTNSGRDDLGAACVALRSRGAGCIVVPDDPGGLADLLGIRRSAIATVLAAAPGPILIARGTFPYQRLLLSATTRPSGIAAAHLAFRFAKTFDASVTSVDVRAPVVVNGEGNAQDPTDAVRSISLAHESTVEFIHREGNPIVEVVDAARDFDLVVTGHRPVAHSRRWGRSIFSPDVSFEVIRRVRQSTLVLPWRTTGG